MKRNADEPGIRFAPILPQEMCELIENNIYSIIDLLHWHCTQSEFYRRWKSFEHIQTQIKVMISGNKKEYEKIPHSCYSRNILLLNSVNETITLIPWVMKCIPSLKYTTTGDSNLNMRFEEHVLRLSNLFKPEVDPVKKGFLEYQPLSSRQRTVLKKIASYMKRNIGWVLYFVSNKDQPHTASAITSENTHMDTRIQFLIGE